MSLSILAFLAGAYLLGSIPFGLLLTRLAGLGDIRQVGSGNIGATNVLRTGRKDLAVATLLLDAGKGAIAVFLFYALALDPWAPLAGGAAFLGHCYPLYLRFKGGKGVATFFGTLFAVDWQVGLMAAAAWLGTVFLSRFSSLGALIAALVATISAYMFLQGSGPLAVGLMASLIFVRHADNIGRLLSGIEPKIGKKPDSESDKGDQGDTV